MVKDQFLNILHLIGLTLQPYSKIERINYMDAAFCLYGDFAMVPQKFCQPEERISSSRYIFGHLVLKRI